MRLFATLSSLLATTALALGLPNSNTKIDSDLALNTTISHNPPLNQTALAQAYLNSTHTIPDPFCQYSFEGLSYHLHAGSLTHRIKLPHKEFKKQLWKCKMHHMTEIKYGIEAAGEWLWELKTHEMELDGIGCVIELLGRSLEMDMWPRCPIIYDS